MCKQRVLSTYVQCWSSGLPEEGLQRAIRSIDDNHNLLMFNRDSRDKMIAATDRRTQTRARASTAASPPRGIGVRRWRRNRTTMCLCLLGVKDSMAR